MIQSTNVFPRPHGDKRHALGYTSQTLFKHSNTSNSAGTLAVWAYNLLCHVLIKYSNHSGVIATPLEPKPY